MVISKHQLLDQIVSAKTSWPYSTRLKALICAHDYRHSHHSAGARVQVIVNADVCETTMTPNLKLMSFFSPFFNVLFLCSDRKERSWWEGKRELEKAQIFHLGGKIVKGEKRKVMSVSAGYNTASYPTGSRREWRWLEENGTCFWFADTVLLSLWVPNKVLAGWLAGRIARLMGLMEFECRGPHLSVVMAGWQDLMDHWSWRLAWQSRSADELWNETDIQKLWAA